MTVAQAQQLANQAAKITPGQQPVADPPTASAINLLSIQSQLLSQSVLELSSVVGTNVNAVVRTASADQWTDDAQPPAGTRATVSTQTAC